MNFRITAMRWLPYFALPLAVLMILIGQTRQAPNADPAAGGQVPLTTCSTLSELPEFQAITDRTTELGSEEMPAYWRLLNTAAGQSFTELSQQSITYAEVDPLLLSPAKFRGATLRLTLNIRRVLSYKVESHVQQIEQLYEVWGWLDGASEQLVVVVTHELPFGIQVGTSVHERAHVCGYFLKLQGYLPAGAETRMSPLTAPLLIGQLEKCDRPQLAFAHNKDWWRIGAGTLLALSLVGSISRRSRAVPKAHPVVNAIDSTKSADLENWLERVNK
jgi:hypothetical protein